MRPIGPHPETMSKEFIEWLIAFILALTPIASPTPVETEPIEANVTTTTTQPAEPALQPTAGEFFVMGIEPADWELEHERLMAEHWATCGNGVYDTKFNPCADQYNATSQWLPLVAGHFSDLGHDNVNIAMCVLYGESRGNPSVTNHIGARGLFQIMPNWADNAWAGTSGISYADLLVPELNVFTARKVYDKQGWGAWSAYGRGYVQDCIGMNAFNAWAWPEGYDGT